MGVWVRGHDVANFSQISKDAPENSTSFYTNVVVVGVGANMVLNENRPKIEKFGVENCVGWHEIKWIPFILCMELISVKSWTPWVILRKKTPTPMGEFPGNWTKNWISPESARFTESFPIFWNRKVAHTKKLFLFLIPEFNLGILHFAIKSVYS